MKGKKRSLKEFIGLTPDEMKKRIFEEGWYPMTDPYISGKRIERIIMTSESKKRLSKKEYDRYQQRLKAEKRKNMLSHDNGKMSLNDRINRYRKQK